jgi:hypothetical protein
MAPASGPSDLSEHGPRFDTCKLEWVADQYQCCVGTHRVQQTGHQRERHHRRLVDHHQVVRQRVGAVIAGLPTHMGSQESMQRLGPGGT